MLRGSSASICREKLPVTTAQSPVSKSWAELATFFERQTTSEGKQYKTDARVQMQEYRSWVYSAVDCIADRVSDVDFSFFRVDNNEELKPSSPYYKAITKPLLHPNDYMTIEFIKGWCQTQLDLCGKAAILKLRNLLGKPWELWPLDMNYFQGIDYGTGMKKNKNPLKPPKGFVFKIDDKNILFEPRDLIWLHYPHPESLWDGFSPIQAQAYITDMDYYLEVYERGFFKNSARVDFILEYEGNMDPDDAQRVKDQWISAYGGYTRSYGTPVIASGGLKVVPMTMSNADFQFVELARWGKDKILGTYRVPEGKLGLFKDINRANQKGIDIAFNEEAVKPRLGLWDKTMTKQLIWAEITENIKMVHDNPVPKDREMDLKELELRGGGGTIPINSPNELRNWWDGSKPAKGGDVILINKNLVPLAEAGKYAGGGGDKPGDTEETPDSDTEHDPGGDESDKLVIPYKIWDRALEPLLKKYDRVLEYTNGWSTKKAEKYAIENTFGDGFVSSLFVDSITCGLSKDQFRKKVIAAIAKRTYQNVKEKKGKAKDGG